MSNPTVETSSYATTIVPSFTYLVDQSTTLSGPMGSVTIKAGEIIKDTNQAILLLGLGAKMFPYVSK